MSRSELRYNKKRKHYAYLFKDLGDYRLNILLTTKPFAIDTKRKKTIIIKNIVLFKHPNPNSTKIVYVVNHRPYCDSINSFGHNVYRSWRWNINDKRKIKRMKKYKKYFYK